MAINEETRYQLYQRLEHALGHEEATTLMEHLPPVGWADVATKHDLEAAVTLLRAEMATFGSELRSEMAAQGGDLRSEMAAGFNSAARERQAINARFDTFEYKLTARLERELRLQSWRLFGSLIAMGTLLVAGLRL